jgi:predicted DCC family thiol-disulfide oxidoreductase YuxK
VSVEEFFRAETSARPLGVARAAVGIAALIRAALQYEILRALLNGEVIQAKRFAWFPDLPLGLFWPFLAIWMLACVSFALGFRTRVSGALLCACLAYQLAWDENLQGNNFYLMALIVFLLTVTDSGCSFSLDRWIFRSGPQQVVRWSTLLPRLQISIVYFYSALVKLNPSFLAGHSIVTSTRMPELLHQTWLPRGTAAATVGVEFFLALALWTPALRRTAFALGFLLHLGIFLGMDGRHTVAMFTFGITMLAPYLLFLEHSPASRLVIWDDSCTFCRRWIAFFRGFDWLEIHRYEGSSNPNALREAHVTRQDADAELKLSFEGRTLGGFDAVREVLCLLPISFLWAPMLAVPPIPAVGRRLYHRVAERRKCAASLPFT